MAKYIQVFSVLLLIAASSLASPQDGPSSITGRHFLTTGSDVKLLLVNTGTFVEPVLVDYVSADGTVLRTEGGPTLMPSDTRQFSATGVPSGTTDVVVRASAMVQVSPASAQVQALAAHAPSVLEAVQTAPADTGQSELAYYLGQQDANLARGAKFQGLVDDLQKKYAADPNAGLREQIRERETFANMLQNMRSEAHRLGTDPNLLPTYDLQVHDAQDCIKNLKADLNARLRVPNTDRTALKNQIDRLQQEIDLNSKLAKVLADKIKSLRDDRRLEGVVSELDAVAKTTGRNSLAGAAAGVIIRDKEKEQ